MKQSVELITYTPDPESVIERCGRICYLSECKDAGAFVRMILKRGHESVLEHASATFQIITDRGISHEIVRHRLASYSQESTRFCKYKELNFIEPAEPNFEWLYACKAAEKAYKSMIADGVAPQFARDVLPMSLATKVVMTANFREWRHFIKLRSAKDAHPKIQEVSNLILEELKSIAPNCFGGL